MSADVAAEPWSGHDFVFVAGMHRSGTTTLAGLIGSAPGCSLLTGTGNPMDEGQFLQDTYPTGRTLGGMTAWALDRRAYADERDAAAVPDVGRRLWRAWSPHWDLDAHHLVEKSPLNLTRTRFLQAALPPSSFVVITRHPISQALAVSTKSKQRAERFGHHLPRMVEGWVLAYETFVRDSPFLRRVHVVRYEHLMSQPEAALGELASFLDVELPGAAAGNWDPARAKAYAHRWDTGQHGSRTRALTRAAVSVRGGRTAFKRPARGLADLAQFPRYEREIRERFSGRIAALGYDIDDLTTARPWESPSLA